MNELSRPRQIKSRPPRRPLKYQIKRNAPLIFSILGIGGVFATGFFGIRAGMKAEQILEELEYPEDIEKKELLKLQAKATWRCYVWTVLSAIAATGCIIASHKLSVKQISTLTALGAGGAAKLNEYRQKVREMIGVEEEEKLYEEVKAKSQWAITPNLPDNIDEDNSDEPVLFFESHSERYFRQKPSVVSSAIYHLNRNFIGKGQQSYNDFCEFLGIDGIDGGDEEGWCDEYMWEGGMFAWIDVYTQEFTVPETGEIARGLFYDIEPSQEAFKSGSVWY